MLKSLVDAKNWRIGAKIFVGFGSVIVLLVLVSGFGVHELSSTGASVARLNTASEAAQRILELDRNTEVMRQRALRFKQLHDKTSIEEFNDSFKEFDRPFDLGKKVRSERGEAAALRGRIAAARCREKEIR